MQTILERAIPIGRERGHHEARTVNVSDEAWIELGRASYLSMYDCRSAYVEALTIYVTPFITDRFKMFQLREAIAHILPQPNNHDWEVERSDETPPPNKKLSLSESCWSELLRVARLAGCNSRVGFLEEFTSTVTVLFTGLSSIIDLRTAVQQIGR